MPTTTKTPPFDAALLKFLKQLAQNNNRDWFTAHKQEYERLVREPLLRFIRDFEPKLRSINPHLVADDRKSGGSLFRIHRDTRFSRDKSPYKPWAAMQFRHEAGKDVHAPGLYLHIQPGQVFAGCGIWHPDGEALAAIRGAIAEQPASWKKAIGARAFRETFTLAGDALKRPPRGYDPEHPFIDDLRRKDFIGVTNFTEKELLTEGFMNELARRMRASRPLMGFLAGALGLDW